MLKGGLIAVVGAVTLCSCGRQEARRPAVEEPPREPTGWVYTEKEDKMRGTLTHQACLRAKPNPDQLNAMADIRAAICLQDQPGTKDLRLFIRVAEDQLRCETTTNCTVYSKLADGEVTPYPSMPWDDRSGTTIYAQSAIDEVLSGKPLMLELPLYSSGSTQFSYNTSGLKFPPTRTSP